MSSNWLKCFFLPMKNIMHMKERMTIKWQPIYHAVNFLFFRSDIWDNCPKPVMSKPSCQKVKIPETQLASLLERFILIQITCDVKCFWWIAHLCARTKAKRLLCGLWKVPKYIPLLIEELYILCPDQQPTKRRSTCWWSEWGYIITTAYEENCPVKIGTNWPGNLEMETHCQGTWRRIHRLLRRNCQAFAANTLYEIDYG